MGRDYQIDEDGRPPRNAFAFVPQTPSQPAGSFWLTCSPANFTAHVNEKHRERMRNTKQFHQTGSLSLEYCAPPLPGKKRAVDATALVGALTVLTTDANTA